MESHKRASIERDCQAANEEEIKSCKDSPSSIDEGWNAILHHQHDMFYGRVTTFLNTKRVMSHATLDSGDKNMSLYEGMADLYKDMMDYNMNDAIDQSQMISFGVDDDAAIDFSQLNPLEFKYSCWDAILLSIIALSTHEYTDNNYGR